MSRVWTAEESCKAFDYRASGMSLAEVGVELGRSKDSVQKHLLRAPANIPIIWDGPACMDDSSLSRRLDSFSVERGFICPDVHAPYHDKAVVALTCRAMKVFQPDRKLFVGDVADCYCISDHDKSPDRLHLFSDEMKITNGVLDQYEEACNCDVGDFIEGNHEERYRRYVARKCPELFGMLSMENHLKIKERGWSWTPYRAKPLQIGHMKFTHDTGYAGASAHIRSRAKIGGNCVIGHTHRMALEYRGNLSAEYHVAAMFGWQGDLTKIDYMHQAEAAEWMHGFGVFYHFPNGDVHLQPIPIVGGRCVVEGKVIE